MKKQKIQNLLEDIYHSAPEVENIVVENKYEDLTTNEMHIIKAVYIREHKGIGAVANYLHLGRHSVAGSINRLEEKGYVTRENHPGGEHTVHLTLTEKGKEALDVYKGIVRKGIENMISEMSDEEVDTIIKGMGLLMGCFDQMIEEYGGGDAEIQEEPEEE